jgi:hypothetical protein
MYVPTRNKPRKTTRSKSARHRAALKAKNRKRRDRVRQRVK